MIKQKSILSFILVFVMCLGLAVPALADSKTATGYKLFTGGAGDAGLLNSWPIHFLITGNYTNNGSDCKLDSVQISAYMEQKNILAGNGSINGSVDETIDYGATISRALWSSVWKASSGIFPGEAVIYFCKECSSNNTFYYLVEEYANYAFACGEYFIYNPTYSFSLNISGPKK